MKPDDALKKKIENKSVRVAVIGLGYVGLPLACAFAKNGIRTTGIDIDKKRVAMIRAGRSYIDDISDTELAAVRKTGRFGADTHFSVLSAVDCAIVCVPTPLGKTRQPDLSFVLAAVRDAAKNLRKGSLLVLESTTYPGTTEENLLPMVEEITGLKVEKDLFLGFSPERVDPANKAFDIADIPKVVGGIGPVSAALVRALYGKVFRKVVAVSSTKTAEMVKLLENTFRSVNIGLINEMSILCHALGIDVWEVIEAAKTKPFGFMPFYPGPGIGGHCISIDPMYLAWKARVHGAEPRLIELAQTINDGMPGLVVDRVSAILNDRGLALRGARILILGMAYKKNVMDTRESPSLAIYARLKKSGARVSYHDSFVPVAHFEEGGAVRSVPLTQKQVRAQDLVLILTDHDGVDYKMIMTSAKTVFDTRNATKGAVRANVIRL